MGEGRGLKSVKKVSHLFDWALMFKSLIYIVSYQEETKQNKKLETIMMTIMKMLMEENLVKSRSIEGKREIDDRVRTCLNVSCCKRLRYLNFKSNEANFVTRGQKTITSRSYFSGQRNWCFGMHF